MSDTPLIAQSRHHDAPDVLVGALHANATPLRIGGGSFVVAAGPCSVEGREMILETSGAVSAAGAHLLRGGAFKPRTSPYAFQGLGPAALHMLAEARRTSGLPVVTEALDVRHVDLVARNADVLQIGARNMHNVPLLAAAAETHLPILLKRGMSATIKELLSAAEYIALHGNMKIMLCERGIRTFESATRNTLDIAAVPVLKQETHLPVFVDPSHAAGDARYVPALAKAALAAGADGIIVEVHPSPANAKSDGAQSLSLEAFGQLMCELAVLANALGRHMPAHRHAVVSVMTSGVEESAA
ncbi:MAG: 3-deoxy-7-phosphoheptulonate synthase [Gemmatimonadaceae bacterium]